MSREFSFAREVERSLQKSYRKTLWHPFTDSVKRYELIQAGDKIAVCVSGGKDSMLLAKLIQQLQRYGPVPFEARFICMDPGYSPANRAQIEKNADLLEVPLHIFSSDVFAVANGSEKNPCYLCARMRRGFLYHEAQELGCNKIALGHHFDDVIETTLIGMFYGSQLQAMLPKLHSTNFPGMELIRPLYQVREEHVIAWAARHGLTFLRCACRFTEEQERGGGGGKRKAMKDLIRRLKATDPDVDQSIFNSIHSVCLDTFPGWKEKGVRRSFLEGYAGAAEP